METPMKFSLKKIKRSKTGGLVLDYQADDRSNSVDGQNRHTPDVPHPDLIAALNALKPALIKSHKLDWQTTLLQDSLVLKDSEKESIKGMIHLIKEGQAIVNNSVEVTGFSLSGDGSNLGVIVTGTLETKNRKIGISSLRIVLESDAFGIEEELSANVDNAIDEVKKYLYEGKVGEQTGDLFSDPETTDGADNLPFGEDSDDAGNDNTVDSAPPIGRGKGKKVETKKTTPPAPKKAATKSKADSKKKAAPPKKKK